MIDDYSPALGKDGLRGALGVAGTFLFMGRIAPPGADPANVKKAHIDYLECRAHACAMDGDPGGARVLRWKADALRRCRRPYNVNRDFFHPCGFPLQKWHDSYRVSRLQLAIHRWFRF